MNSNSRTRYLIDTNIFGLSLTNFHPDINKFLLLLEPAEFVVSCFVLAEVNVLQFSQPSKNISDLIEFLQNQKIIWFDKGQLEIFSFLKYKMAQIKINNRTIDWFIAAQCLEGNYTLVTANRKDFEHISNLKAKYYDQKSYHWY